jgi:ubiquinone/menaquinone biosynthesis C-methylase UbiE
MVERPEARRGSFERIADRYDETRGGQDRGDRMADGLAAYLNPRTSVLEPGVGTGAVAGGLARLGFTVIGVDVAPSMVVRARERIGGRAFMADAERLPFADGSFRQAYSVWIQHVLEDRPAHFAEMARVLAPRGRYAIVPRGRPGDALGEELEVLRTHLRPDWEVADSPEGIAEVATAAGFRVTDVIDLPPADFKQSPAALATEIRSRVYSILWDVDEQGWWSVVEPVLIRLESMPNPDRPIRRAHLDRIVLLERGV